METLYTKLELNRISHSLGIDLFKAVMSHKLKDKQLPDEFYRNHYQDEQNDVLDGLVSLGYAIKRKALALNYYHITELGVSKFRTEFKELVNYQPEDKRDLAYLKHRINWYCDFYNYRFCDDNSEHIIDAYIMYYLKGFKMSHTTTDTVNFFKKELKKYFKDEDKHKEYIEGRGIVIS
jgi:hypothetical protein